MKEEGLLGEGQHALMLCDCGVVACSNKIGGRGRRGCVCGCGV